MRRLQILHYLLHVNTWDLILYFLPILSLFCISIAHYKIYKVASEIKKRRSVAKKFWAIRYIAIFNFAFLFILALKYLDKNEPPQKELIFKQAKVTKSLEMIF